MVRMKEVTLFERRPKVEIVSGAGGAQWSAQTSMR